jgi:hypothetical protein
MARASKAITKAPATPEVLPAEQFEDLNLITQVGDAIRNFMRGVAEFFRTAQTLELRSKATLMGAKALQLPTDAGSDEVLQRYAKRIQAEKKEVEDHWQITTVVHALHRRLTARRKIATDALELAAERVNTLHNTYTEAEKRRVAAENDRIRREAEEKARREQEAEAARLERQALEAEFASKDLSERERQFVALVVDGVDTQIALRRVGYADPVAAGKRLIGLAKITKAIDAGLTAKNLRKQAEAVREQPAEVADVELERPDITKGVAIDRTTYSAELVDEQALINAAIAGQVPRDILRIDTVKLNEHARGLKEGLNRWPGVRLKKSTRMV